MIPKSIFMVYMLLCYLIMYMVTLCYVIYVIIYMFIMLTVPLTVQWFVGITTQKNWKGGNNQFVKFMAF